MLSAAKILAASRRSCPVKAVTPRYRRPLHQRLRACELDTRDSGTFNTSLEAGLRALFLLAAAGRRALDLQTLIYLDYALVHTDDFDGPSSLHPRTPSQRSQLLDWGGVDIAGVLGERTGLPVYIGNDATLGALAEWRLGAGTAVDDLVYVMLGEGVGCGLVLGGRLHTGASGTAGELGHLPSDGKICRCGSRGCLETVVSKRALVSALAHTMGLEAKVGTLLDLADVGDRGALRLLTDAGDVLGKALAGVCTGSCPVPDPRNRRTRRSALDAARPP